MTDRRIDVDVRVEPSTPDHYRREWLPDPGTGLAGMWIGAIVGDASGPDYWGLRGADDFVTGMTHVVSPITGFKTLQPEFVADTPHLFAEYSSIDWFEPLEYTDTGTATKLGYSSGRIERDGDGMHWFDASGRWQLYGRNVSDVVTIHVPPQDGVAQDVYYRHELLWATGTVNGEAVSGYLHQDFAYGPPGMIYPELAIARHLQGMWVSWLHEYADGTLGGGCFWQGRQGTTFGPGYQFKDGLTTAHDDIRAEPTFDGSGRLVALDAFVGSDVYSFGFHTAGSPIHYFGRLTHSSSGKAPARSWCWVEYAAGMLTPEILDLLVDRFRLARAH